MLSAFPKPHHIILFANILRDYQHHNSLIASNYRASSPAPLRLLSALPPPIGDVGATLMRR